MESQAHGSRSLAAAEETPFVNQRDPARQLGPDGKPAVSRRAPMWDDVPDEKWNDWRWQLSNRVNELAEIEQILELTDEEREGLSAPDKFRVDVTPYFISLIDPKDPEDPIRRQIIPLGRELRSFTGMMEDSLAEDRHSPVPGLVHRYPDRVLMLITTQCASYCRYCTRSRIVGDPTQNFNRREHEAQLDYIRRTPQIRDVLISGGDGLTLAPEAPRVGAPRPARDPARRDHPDRLAGAGVPAAADRRRAVRDARQVPPAVDEHPRQPPPGDHPGAGAGLRQAEPGRHPAGQPVGAARRRQRLRPHPARARASAGREPRPALLHLPVRPGRGRRALPDAGGQGPRDHRGPPRPHVGLRGPAVHRRCARRRREDPGHAQLPRVLLGPQGDPPQLRGLHHHLRGAAGLPAARPGVAASTARTRARSRARRASPGCSTASGCGSSPRASGRSTSAARRSSTGSRTPPSGCRSASGRSRGPSTRDRLPVLEAGTRTARARSRDPPRACRPAPRTTSSCRGSSGRGPPPVRVHPARRARRGLGRRSRSRRARRSRLRIRTHPRSRGRASAIGVARRPDRDRQGGHAGRQEAAAEARPVVGDQGHQPFADGARGRRTNRPM